MGVLSHNFEYKIFASTIVTHHCSVSPQDHASFQINVDVKTIMSGKSKKDKS